MNVLKTFKAESRGNNLPGLFKPPPTTAAQQSSSIAPRTNLTNISQTIIRPIRPPYYNNNNSFGSSRSTMTRSSVIKRRMRSNFLLFFTILGCGTGVALGAYARTLPLRPSEKAYFGFPGELFLRMLKFAIVPLIASSLVSGVASLGQSRMTSRVARRAFVYYFTTTFLAVVLGLVLVMFIKPGFRVKLDSPSGSELSSATPPPSLARRISPLDTIFDLLRNLFPDNIVQMTFMQYESRMVPKYKPHSHTAQTQQIGRLSMNSSILSNLTIISGGNISNVSSNSQTTPASPSYSMINLSNLTLTEILNLNSLNLSNISFTTPTPTTSTTTIVSTSESSSNRAHQQREIDYWYAQPGERHGINVLGLVMFCAVLGYVLPQMKRRGKMLIDLCESMNQASIKIIGIIMMLSPIGICSLICHAVLIMDNPKIVFEKISYYLGTVVLGLLIHGMIILPLLFIVITKKNIFVYAKNMFEALLVAFVTSSSNASLSVTLNCIEEKNRIPRSISRFVLPVGATINMDGTALYEAVAAIFIAQLNNIDLKLGDYIVASLTATVASIGAAGIPSSGLVTMIMVLSALNLPQGQISLIYAVDWFLDRFRTTVNVWGDAVGTGIVAHLSRDELQSTKNVHQTGNTVEYEETEYVEKKPPMQSPPPIPEIVSGNGNGSNGGQNKDEILVVAVKNEENKPQKLDINNQEHEDEVDEEEDDDETEITPDILDEEPKKLRRPSDPSSEKQPQTNLNSNANSNTNSNSSLIPAQQQQPQQQRINEGYVTDEQHKNNETTF